MKKIVALALALVMVFALCACGSSSSSKTLVVGTSADYPPYEFMYKDDSGEMVYGGLDLWFAEFLAEEMGKELQIENMSFDYLLTALSKGDYDVVIAGIEINEERLQVADFSDPYYTDIPAMLLVPADKVDAYTTLSDFDGLSVGAQTATTKEDLVQELMPGANLVSEVNVNDLVNELIYGKIDAILLDGAVAKSFAEKNEALGIAAASDELPQAEPYRVVVAKGDPKGLLDDINAAIAKLTDSQIAEWYELANELTDSGEAIEVSVDAPAA